MRPVLSYLWILALIFTCEYTIGLTVEIKKEKRDGADLNRECGKQRGAGVRKGRGETL